MRPFRELTGIGSGKPHMEAPACSQSPAVAAVTMVVAMMTVWFLAGTTSLNPNHQNERKNVICNCGLIKNIFDPLFFVLGSLHKTSKTLGISYMIKSVFYYL